MEKAGQSWKYESVASFPDFGAPLTDGVVSLRHFTLDDVSEVARSPRPRDCTVDRIITDPYSESDARGGIERHAERWNSCSVRQITRAVVPSALRFITFPAWGPTFNHGPTKPWVVDVLA